MNNDLKQKLRQQPQPASKEGLTKYTRARLRHPALTAYFKPPAVRYAA